MKNSTVMFATTMALIPLLGLGCDVTVTPSPSASPQPSPSPEPSPSPSPEPSPEPSPSPAPGECLAAVEGVCDDATCFEAILTDDQETPPLDTGGSGRAGFVLSDDQTRIDFAVDFFGLTGAVTSAHFHMAPIGVAGGIIFDVSSAFSSANLEPITDPDLGDGFRACGAWTLVEGDLENINAGQIYLNLHTMQNPAGEIRGQLVPVN